MRHRQKQLLEEIWRFFISLKLTFVLLVILGIGAILGMSYDQTLSYDEFLSKSPQIGLKASLVNFLELYDAFHSWWFSLVILFLSANLIACSLERLPRIYFDARRPRPYLTNRRLLALSLKEEKFARNILDVDRLLKKFFGLNYKKFNLKKSNYYFKQQQVIGRFGVYIVHIALLIVMYSAIYATQNGVDGHVIIEEGERTRFISAKGAGGVNYTYDLGFYIGCDDFRLSTFIDNSPMEFESDLNISLPTGDPIIRQTVRVNEPLSYAGFTFYQSSFRPVISEKIVNLALGGFGNSLKRYQVRLNTEIVAPSGDKFIPQKIYDDFAGLGEALRVAKISPEGQQTFFHIFRKYPEYDQQVRTDTNYLLFLGTDQKYATGLSIGKVPAITSIFSGFLLFLVGCFMCFFLTPVRYFARVDRCKDESGYIIIFAAQGFRHQESVKLEFQKKLLEIKGSC